MPKDNDKIGYAIITLTETEAEETSNSLSDPKQPAEKIVLGGKLASIINSNYDKNSESWKPFGDLTLNEIFVNLKKSYESKCDTIYNITHDDKVGSVLIQAEEIKMFFIDAFATFNNTYENLAKEIGPLISLTSNCCMIVSDQLDTPTKNILNDHLKAVWDHPYKTGLAGRNHDIINSSAELKRFINMGFIDPKNAKLNVITLRETLKTTARNEEMISIKETAAMSG